jgi:hypothetical protein
MHAHKHIRHDDEAASRLAPKGDDGCFHFRVAMNGGRGIVELRGQL